MTFKEWWEKNRGLHNYMSLEEFALIVWQAAFAVGYEKGYVVAIEEDKK